MRGAQPGADRVTIEPVAGEPFPEQPDGALIAEPGDQLDKGMAAHPQNSPRAVAVAQHRFGGNQPGKPAIHVSVPAGAPNEAIVR